MTGQRPSAAVEIPGVGLDRLVAVVAVLVVVELMLFAGRYGYHGDELYFIVAGSHPAFGYPDQPPLVPMLAGLMHHIAASLYLLRLPSALAAAATVVVAGAIARDAGGGRRAQLIAASGPEWWSASASRPSRRWPSSQSCH